MENPLLKIFVLQEKHSAGDEVVREAWSTYRKVLFEFEKARKNPVFRLIG